MSQQEIFLAYHITRPQIHNILKYLKDYAKFDVAIDNKNSRFVFYPQDKKNYFQMIKAGDSSGLDDTAINQLSSEYPNFSMVDSRSVCEDAVSVIKGYNRNELEENDFSKLCILMDTFKSLVFSYSDILPSLLKQQLMPLYFKLFPNGALYILRKDILLEKRFAALRALPFVTNEEFIKNVKGGKDFPGFGTLRNFHMPSIYDIADYLKPAFLFFQDFIFGFACTTGINKEVRKGTQANVKDEFELIFLFGESMDWLPKASYEKKGYQKQTPNGGIENTICAYLPVSINWDIGSYYKSRFQFPRTPSSSKLTFNTKNHHEFLEWWIFKLDKLYYYLLNPAHFIDEHSYIQADKQFLMVLTVDRIFKETSLIQTELRQRFNAPSFGALNLSFALLDKLANLMSPGAGSQVEAQNFKKLLKKSQVLPSIKQILEELPSPLDNYLRNQLNTVFAELEGSIRKAIFFDIFTTPLKDELMIGSKKMRFEDYIPELLRTIRNSNHGYLFSDMKKFDNLRFFKGGDLINVFPQMMKFYILWMLAKIEKLQL